MTQLRRKNTGRPLFLLLLIGLFLAGCGLAELPGNDAPPSPPPPSATNEPLPTLPPTFTPTHTPTITPTFTATATPSATFTPSVADICEDFRFVFDDPTGQRLTGVTSLAAFYATQYADVVLFEATHAETGESVSFDLPGGVSLYILNLTADNFPTPGRYEWQVRLQLPDGSTACERDGEFVMLAPEGDTAADVTSEAAPRFDLPMPVTVTVGPTDAPTATDAPPTEAPLSASATDAPPETTREPLALPTRSD